MTFIDQPKGDADGNKKAKATNSHDSKKNPNLHRNYPNPNQGVEKPGNQVEKIGLTGGQSEDTIGGVDMSQYTGPESKPSSQFNDLEAEYGTGPGAGLSKKNHEQKSEQDNLGKSNKQA